MKFTSPFWLYGMPVVACLCVLILFFEYRWRKNAIWHLLSESMCQRMIVCHSWRVYWLRRLCFVAAVMLLMLACARPQYGYVTRERLQRGVDMLFAIDVSRSMLAEDVKPNRLGRAKLDVGSFVNRLSGDRVGLLVFAGDAFLQCPLTLDFGAFKQSLDAVDTNVMDVPGTNLGAAIELAKNLFCERSNKALIILTDGEDLDGLGVKEAEAAAKNGVKIFALGVGSASGEIIPLKKADGTMDYVRDADGKVVKSKLDEATLKTIASATGAMYANIVDEGFEKIYTQIKTFSETHEERRMEQAPREVYAPFVMLALLFLIFI